MSEDEIRALVREEVQKSLHEIVGALVVKLMTAKAQQKQQEENSQP